MSARVQAYVWFAQRFSGAVLALCVAVHLATIVMAVQGGLSAAEILGRTRGNTGWAVFYAVFVLAVAVHAPIGLRAILREWSPWRGAGVDLLVAAIGVGIALFGWRAVGAVVG